jgi:hypothetical protein
MTVEAPEMSQEASDGASWSYVDALILQARTVALSLAKRYSLCDLEDIASEIVTYVYSKPKVLREWEDFVSMEGEVDEEEARHVANRMNLILRRAGERYCRKELAAQLGYSPEDEAFYSLPALRALVEWYYKEGITERPPVGRDKSPRRGDPATGGDWMVSLLDVQRGLGIMPRKYRARLRCRYESFGDRTDQELAEMVGTLATPKGTRERIEKHLGYTPKQMASRVSYALSRLQRAIGGPNPYMRLQSEHDLAA